MEPLIYFNPEKFDLELVVEVDLAEPDYSFDLLCIWRHTKTGKLYMATDSGCSCPIPFEFVKFEDLTPVDNARQVEFIMEETGNGVQPYVPLGRRKTVVQDIKKLLKEAK